MRSSTGGRRFYDWILAPDQTRQYVLTTTLTPEKRTLAVTQSGEETLELDTN